MFYVLHKFDLPVLCNLLHSDRAGAAGCLRCVCGCALRIICPCRAFPASLRASVPSLVVETASGCRSFCVNSARLAGCPVFGLAGGQAWRAALAGCDRLTVCASCPAARRRLCCWPAPLIMAGRASGRAGRACCLYQHSLFCFVLSVIVLLVRATGKRMFMNKHMFTGLNNETFHEPRG